MAVNINTIESWLKKINATHKRVGNEIGLGIAQDKSKYKIKTWHTIEAHDDGSMLYFHAYILQDNDLLKIPSTHQNIKEVLLYILYQSYGTKIGGWEYNYKDGSIRFSTKVPLMDSSMTYNQFETILMMIVNSIDSMAKGILKTLQTGKIAQDGFQYVAPKHSGLSSANGI